MPAGAGKIISRNLIFPKTRSPVKPEMTFLATAELCPVTGGVASQPR
jgi:hypothetical protein